MTPRDFRKTMAIAVMDDLFHGQPELQYRDVNRQAADGTVFKVYEVRGFIDPAKLGTFGAQQLERVMEHNYPGLLAHLNGQHKPMRERVEAILWQIDTGAANDDVDRAVTAVLDLLRYAPDFTDL